MDANRKRADMSAYDAVSIHAPVMDANGSPDYSKELGSFNPRARDGREPTACSTIKAIKSFNPRARDGREELANPILSN